MSKAEAYIQPSLSRYKREETFLIPICPQSIWKLPVGLLLYTNP